MIREVRIDVIRVLAVMLVGGLCLLPVSGLAFGPTIMDGCESISGDPTGGDRFNEGIPSGGGGGGLIGDDSPSEESDTSSGPRDSTIFIPIAWPPAGGWWIQIPEGRYQVIAKDVRSLRERH
jgi:hypothetical protein